MRAFLESRNLRSFFGCSSSPLGPEKSSLYRLLPTMATSSAALSITTGGSYFDSCNLQSNKFKKLGRCQSQLATRQNPMRRRNLSVRAEYGDASRGDGGGDFLAGFLFGGAVFGTLAYVFAPQIRRSILNEDEYGFQKAKRPMYYGDGLEITRLTLNDKISQLNSAIDNVSSRLRGGINVATQPTDADSEVEATM